MERLLWTPDQIAEQQIIPYCAEEIRRLVRRGEIPAVRRQGWRILIHYRDLEAYADRFRSGHTAPTGPQHDNKMRRGHATSRRERAQNSHTSPTRHAHAYQVGLRAAGLPFLPYGNPASFIHTKDLQSISNVCIFDS